MSTPDSETNWSDTEWKLLNTVEIFQLKPGIMKKAEGYLTQLKEALAEECKDHPHPYPASTDLAKGQIARGENHNGFPFLSMDLPQMFSKTEFFTYRVLFWWGHYLGFSLLLKGPQLPAYLQCILEKRHEPYCKDIYLARNDSPWEWGWTEDNFQPLSHGTDAELTNLIERIQYVKLIRSFPMTASDFPKMNWVTTGIGTYRDFMNLIMK